MQTWIHNQSLAEQEKDSQAPERKEVGRSYHILIVNCFPSRA